MTREEQDRLLNDIHGEEVATRVVLARLIRALPVADPSPVAQTDLEAAAHDVCSAGDLVLCVIAKTSDGNESRPLTNAQCFLELKDAIARVRAAMGRKDKP